MHTPSSTLIDQLDLYYNIFVVVVLASSYSSATDARPPQNTCVAIWPCHVRCPMEKDRTKDGHKETETNPGILKVLAANKT